MVKMPHRILHGTPVSPGLNSGFVIIHDNRPGIVKREAIAPSQVDAEVRRLEEAVERTRAQLRQTRQMVSARIDKAHAAIFEAQEMLLDDPLLIERCRREIRAQRLNAEFILDEVVKEIRAVFEQIKAPNLSLQDLDVLDVAERIQHNLRAESGAHPGGLEREGVIVAHGLHPSETAHLDPRRVLGIATETGGPTSHFAILAKALKIPAIAGLKGLLSQVNAGDQVIVDGFSGALTLQPSRYDLDRLRQRRQALKSEEESLVKLRNLPCETKDGYAVELVANMEFPSELAAVRETGACGIGLFRSEFFYIDRGKIPDEEKQFQVYRQVIEGMAPQPVTCRTLDLGGDKFISPADMVGEDMNPFLGLRAIRLCLANPDLFRSQMRAILRASAYGKAKMMFPLITDVGEVRRARELLDQTRNELQRKGVAFDAKMPVGIMIETPSAALTSDILAREVDFFSIGTNDLIQYTMAADRVNERVADLYNPLHPSVIELIRRTIEAAHRAGIGVGVCGEMAADPVMAVLLMGMGVDQLSMSSVAIPEVKRLIRSLTLEEVRNLRVDVLAGLRSGEAAQVLNRFRRRQARKRKRSAP